MHFSLTAAKALRRVIDQGQSLDRALESSEDNFNGNIPELKEWLFGACRYYIYVNGILSNLLKKPIKEKDRIVHFLLVCAIYRLEFMQTPDHAVVNESVNALDNTKQSWAKNLTNAVLRNFLRNKSEITGLLKEQHVLDAFPKHLHDRIASDWPDYDKVIFLASNKKPPLTLRVNQTLTTRSLYEKTLKEENLKYILTEDSNIGIILNNPLNVNRIPGFAEGKVSIQDESAQLITRFLAADRGQRILDGCAAPGGKTCLILENQPDLELMVAVDFPDRIDRISQNLDRLKLKAQVISADINDTQSWWDGIPFDGILLDVPCSGSGVIRRHPDIKHRRQPSDIEKFSKQQLTLMNSVWPLLKPSGRLLYVTCSVFKTENDGVIEKFIQDKEDVELQSLNEKLGLETSFGRQRLPGVQSGDGFYYCGMRKSLLMKQR